MKVTGIIAEFNPLHTGHEKLLHAAREKTGADYIVVVMSGDYVQRGEPAFFTKEFRTFAALSCGADLILELPLSLSTASAEYFARGGVSLLESLGCVNCLCFGSESGNSEDIKKTASLLALRDARSGLTPEETPAYRTSLAEFLKMGMSFPQARQKALSAVLSSTAETSLTDFPKDEAGYPSCLSLLEAPNNILAVEYVKALLQINSSISPITFQRAGAGYHDEMPVSTTDRTLQNGPLQRGAKNSPDSDYASSSGLRKLFYSKNPCSEEEVSEVFDRSMPYLPAPCQKLYHDALLYRQFLTADDLSLPLLYTLLQKDKAELEAYLDMTPELAEKIIKTLPLASSFTDLCLKMKSRHITYARISRCLLHILLDIKKRPLPAPEDGLLYARILGFRKEAEPLLHQIKENAFLPLVSKLADAKHILAPAALSELEKSISASRLYHAALLQKPGFRAINLPYLKREAVIGSEYARGIVVL